MKRTSGKKEINEGKKPDLQELKTEIFPGSDYDDDKKKHDDKEYDHNHSDNKCSPYPYPGYYYPLQCLGYAYIPWQMIVRLFSPSEALQKGTLFPELYSPYFPEARPPVVPIPYLNYGERKKDKNFY